MSPVRKLSVEEVLKKHGAKIEHQMNNPDVKRSDYSGEYIKFKEEMFFESSKYERWCKSLGSMIKLNVAEKDKVEVENYLKRLLGTSVKITPGLKRGKIEIEYYTDEDLERMLELFRKIEN